MVKVKTTEIKKKTKTGKEITINFAKVVDRLNEFRKDNPRGRIDTQYKMDGDNLVFKTYILKDKSDTNSADATGHAMARYDGTDKMFEKLETISVGRALALLGYAASGEVASEEEMEEFAAFKAQKVEEAIDKINATKSIEELRELFTNNLGSLIANSQVIAAKDKKKAELQNES